MSDGAGEEALANVGFPPPKQFPGLPCPRKPLTHSGDPSCFVNMTKIPLAPSFVWPVPCEHVLLRQHQLLAHLTQGCVFINSVTLRGTSFSASYHPRKYKAI